MFGVPMDKIKKGNPEYAYRAKGKVATLALGYQGSSGALINMGALRSGLTEDELPDIVNRWRRSNPAIVNFWYQVEAAAMEAVQNGRTSTVGPVTIGREFDSDNGLDFMTILLPSKRKLYYVQPHMGVNRFGKPQPVLLGAKPDLQEMGGTGNLRWQAGGEYHTGRGPGLLILRYGAADRRRLQDRL